VSSVFAGTRKSSKAETSEQVPDEGDGSAKYDVGFSFQGVGDDLRIGGPLTCGRVRRTNRFGHRKSPLRARVIEKSNDRDSINHFCKDFRVLHVFDHESRIDGLVHPFANDFFSMANPRVVYNQLHALSHAGGGNALLPPMGPVGYATTFPNKTILGTAPMGPSADSPNNYPLLTGLCQPAYGQDPSLGPPTEQPPW